MRDGHPSSTGSPGQCPLSSEPFVRDKKPQERDSTGQRKKTSGKKVIEEVGELSEARSEGDDRLDHELGDLLLALTSYARHRGLRPEESLARANDRFSKRFRHMEEECRHLNRELSSLSPDEWDRLWENAKKTETSRSAENHGGGS